MVLSGGACDIARRFRARSRLEDHVAGLEASSNGRPIALVVSAPAFPGAEDVLGAIAMEHVAASVATSAGLYMRGSPLFSGPRDPTPLLQL